MIMLERWIGTDGRIGAIPEDYPLWLAADRCHCPPWVLAEKSVWWQDRALKIASAESKGRAEKARHNQ